MAHEMALQLVEVAGEAVDSRAESHLGEIKAKQIGLPAGN